MDALNATAEREEKVAVGSKIVEACKVHTMVLIPCRVDTIIELVVREDIAEVSNRELEV